MTLDLAIRMPAPEGVAAQADQPNQNNQRIRVATAETSPKMCAGTQCRPVVPLL